MFCFDPGTAGSHPGFEGMKPSPWIRIWPSLRIRICSLLLTVAGVGSVARTGAGLTARVPAAVMRRSHTDGHVGRVGGGGATICPAHRLDHLDELLKVPARVLNGDVGERHLVLVEVSCVSLRNLFGFLSFSKFEIFFFQTSSMSCWREFSLYSLLLGRYSFRRL